MHRDMFTISKRMSVLRKILQVQYRTCSNTRVAHAPRIKVTPALSMVDEQIRMQLSGLKPSDMVTLVASVYENNCEFESRCVYQTDENGETDNLSSVSLGGTFKGVHPMGLFWSLQSSTPSGNSVRLVKKDVSAPMDFDIKVYPGNLCDEAIHTSAVTEAKVQRLYKKPGVKRIPLTGKFKGVLFIPEGKGPFPGLIDMSGALVSIVETRAALLASHGYATLALSYMLAPGLPGKLFDTDFYYIKEAFEWFMDQDYIDNNRLGAVGHCFGGSLLLLLTSRIPKIKAVVNINGIGIVPKNLPLPVDIKNAGWPGTCTNKVLCTKEGVVIRDVYEYDEPSAIPAWEHGAKILIIAGEDDRQMHPKWHTFFCGSVPQKFKSNVELHCYPGAGHLIEPPYSPHTRTVTPGRKRMASIDFIPEQFHDERILSGGWTEPHAYAQEDAWRKVLGFLEKHVRHAK